MCLYIQNIVCNDNLQDLKMQFDIFATLFMNARSSLKRFRRVVLSDVWPLYRQTFESNELMC